MGINQEFSLFTCASVTGGKHFHSAPDVMASAENTFCET